MYFSYPDSSTTSLKYPSSTGTGVCLPGWRGRVETQAELAAAVQTHRLFTAQELSVFAWVFMHVTLSKKHLRPSTADLFLFLTV